MTDSEKDRLMWGGCSLQEARDILDREEAVLDHIQSENARLLAEKVELKTALERIRQGYRNALDLRICRDGRAHLTREELREALQEVESALRPHDAPPAPNPSPAPAESADGGVS